MDGRLKIGLAPISPFAILESMRFEDFDSRGYRSVDVRTGYAEWVGTYEQTVQDAMDIALLEQLTVPDWSRTARAIDLGCGTGRTGEWLHQHGVSSIDGVDLTPEMLAVARRRETHDRLLESDVRHTDLAANTYDLAVASLIDEHMSDLRPLYREAWRIAAPEATLVLVAFHPHFIMLTGMPTHYDNEVGEPIAITTNVHLLSHHVQAAIEAGWQLAEMREAVVDDEWIAAKPKWERYRNHPVSVAYVWQKRA